MKPDNLVRELERSRQAAAAAAADYTIGRAVSDAQWVRSTPDGLLTPERAKQCIVTLLAALEASKCYFNATLRGQETFVLVQQDRAAPSAILAWAVNAGEHGCPRDKLEHAYQVARKWGQQPSDLTKWPD